MYTCMHNCLSETGNDFIIFGINTVLLLQENIPVQIRVLFLVDQIAQESEEMVQLYLNLSNSSLPMASGGIFRDTITLTIRDSTGKL